MSLRVFEIGYHTPDKPNHCRIKRVLTSGEKGPDAAAEFLRTHLGLDTMTVRFSVMLPKAVPSYCECCGQKKGETQPGYGSLPPGTLESEKHLWRTIGTQQPEN